MEFFTRVLSGNSRLSKERAREAEQVNMAFKANLDNLEGVLESEERSNVYALLDMIYESSFPEEQIFMKTPSRARLKSKKELLVRLLIGLDALGVPTMAEMLMFIRKHGLEGIAESLVTLLELLSQFLEGKQAPEFTTDDVMNAMDFQWHSTSRTGSPLLNVIASATSSPRASAASLGDSPLNPIVSASPFRRAVSDRSMFLSRSHELGAKSVLDKTSASTSPHHPTLTVAASSKYPYTNQYFGSKEITSEMAASPEITLPSIDEKPPSYSLDTLPPSSEHATQRRHRRQSSSLRELFAEDTIDEVSWEGSVGASSKRNSSSSSWRRNSSEFPKVLTNVSGSGPSSPINPGLETGGGASDKEILSTIQSQDRKINGSSRKGSRRILPPQPYNEVAFWREDIDGFTVDLASINNKNPAQTSVSSAIHEKSSGNIHETERHIDETEKCIDTLEAAPLSEDAPPAKKGTVEQHGILPTVPSLLSSTVWDDSLSVMSQTPQADISSNRSHISSLGGGSCESKEPSVKTNHCHADKDNEDLDHIIDVQSGDSAKHNSVHDPLEEEEFGLMLQDHNEVFQHRNIYGVGNVEDIISVHAKDNPQVATQEGCSEDESNKGEGIRGEDEFNRGEDICSDSIADNDHDLNVGYVDANRASFCDNTDSPTGEDEFNKGEDVGSDSISDNDLDLNVGRVGAYGASTHDNTDSSSGEDECIECEDGRGHSISDDDHDLNVGYVGAYGASLHYYTVSSSGEDECNKGEGVRGDSISGDDHNLNVEYVGAYGASLHDNTVSSSGEDEFNKGKDVSGDSMSDEEHDLNVGYVSADGASPNDSTLPSSGEDECNKGEDVHGDSISYDDHDLNVGYVEHFSSESEGLKDELKRHAFKGASDKSLQIKQSHDVMQHGHHRSHSDLTPVRSLFKAEFLLQEQKLIKGSRSDCDVETYMLRRRFAKRFRSLTVSMESLMVREGSPGRVVMQESMPWMHVNESSHGKEQSEEMQIVKGSVSDSESSTSEESTSSASSSADDATCKSPYQDGKPLKLHELEAEEHSSSVDYAGQHHEFDAGSQCKRDADFEEHARHSQSMDINHEDAKNATYLLDITTEEQPGQTSALDNYEERTSTSLDNQQQQNERKSASDEINPEDSIQEGIGFPWISLAPLLLPSTRHVCEDAHDLPVIIHESESLQGGFQQVGVGGEKDPFLKEQDDTLSPSHMSSLSLQNDKILNHTIGSISDEKENIEMHASCQDLQCPLEAVDSNQYSPIPAANMTNDVPLSLVHAWPDNITKVLPIEEERGHLLSYMLADVPTTTSHAKHKSSSPSDGECSMQIDLSELSDNLHQDDHIEIEGNTEGIRNCEISSMDKCSFKDNVSSDGAGMSSVNELDAYPLSHSLEEDMQKISPEMMKEDDKKDNVQPMNLHVDDVPTLFIIVDQGPCVAKAGLEEQLKCNDDQFEQLLSEIDAAEELGTALHASGELPLIHAQSDMEGGKMGTHDNVQEGVPHEEDFSREWEDERMRTDEKMRSGEGKIRSDDDSDKEIVFHTEGQFITGGPGHIPALANFDDFNNCMQDDSEVPQASPNLQDMESSLEQKLQDFRGFHESTDGSMHECPLENQLSLASLKSHEAYEETSPDKLDHDRQRLPYPLTIVDVLHEGELITPCWEASEVVDVSRSHPLRDDEDRMRRSAAQSTDPGLAAQFTDSGRHCAVTANSLHDDDRIQRSATRVMDMGTQCADNVNSLHDDDDCIQRLATQFPDSGRQCAVNSSRLDSLQEDDDRSQLLAARFKESGRQCVVNVSSSYSLHDDHMQRSARQSRGARSSSAVVAADDDCKGPIHGGDVASLQDHEHQQFDNLCSPLSLSKKVDLQEASLHGHPNVDPQKQTDQHVLNHPATYHDPTSIDRWDVHDSEEARSKRRNGGTSCVGRLARGCLSCCRKPHTNP